MPITKNMEKLISDNAPMSEMELLAKKEGLVTILESGLVKIKEGITTLEEVLKVVNE